jgi:heme-degrading monooxygenase HmoA
LSATSYYAVIFTSQRNPSDVEAYDSMSALMAELAKSQEGFLDMESVRNDKGLGITVSYWKTLESISEWKKNSEHQVAQKLGITKWYKFYKIRICKVEREYGRENE